jgi:hypothetical protein
VNPALAGSGIREGIAMNAQDRPADARPAGNGGAGPQGARPARLPVSLREEKTVDPSEWNGWVERLGGSPFHTTHWIAFSNEVRGRRPVHFTWRDGAGEVRAIAAGSEGQVRVAGWPVFRTLTLGSLPVSNSTLPAIDLVRDVAAFARTDGYGSLEIGSYGTPEDLPELPRLGFSVSRRWEFVLDLQHSKEALWDRLHQKKRNLIRKAQKSGVQVARGSAVDDLLLFRDIGHRTWLRKRSRGIDFPPVAGERYYRLLARNVLDPGIGRLYLARHLDEPVAGAFLAGYAGRAYYVLSAAADEGLACAAPDLILWTAICDCLQAGYRLFNFGGVSEEELGGEPVESSGLYHFKIRFSPEAAPCLRGAIVLRPRLKAVLSLIERARQGLRRGRTAGEA